MHHPQQHISTSARRTHSQLPEGFRLPAGVQRKLQVGSAHDPQEHEADVVAEQVVNQKGNMPLVDTPVMRLIQRKCAACSKEEEGAQRKVQRMGGPEEEEKVQKKGMPGQEEEQVQMKGMPGEEEEKVQMKGDPGAGFTATADVSQKIDAQSGKGSPLPENTRTEMESGFGADFSGVRIHTGPEAVQLSRDLNAQAFTYGNDIFFNSGKMDTGSTEGKKLLAHELTHTIQQGGVQRKVQRTLSVMDPKGMIQQPPGANSSSAQFTNAEVAAQYLQNLCPESPPLVDLGTGTVNVADESLCTEYSNNPGQSEPGKHFTGCGCICDIVKSGHAWQIQIDDSSWPHTTPDDHVAGSTPGKGTGGIVTAPSPNDDQEWGAVTESGKATVIDPWLVLGHELCGHAWMMNSGNHGDDEKAKRGRGGHSATVDRENLLRNEHGMSEMRGGLRAPYCGESFSYDKGGSFQEKNLSSYYGECKQWRDEYNKLNGTSLKYSDPIPKIPGEKFPKDTFIDGVYYP